MKKFIHTCLGFLSIGATLSGVDFPLCPIENMDLRPDYILVHHPVSTKNPGAQLYFDQGLTLMYAFNHDAAFCSFQQAAKLDPQLAMAYWGMALAIGPNINIDITHKREKAAYELVRKALSLADQVTESEKGYIQALTKRYSNADNPDRAQLSKDYYQAMQLHLERFPDDLDAAVLLAESGLDLNPWNQWTLEGAPKGNTVELIKVLESVLNRDPNHLGANHYYIHVMEASDNPGKALQAADRLKKMSKTLGHIVHMPSHIYMLVGDYREAALCNEDAVAADREYIRTYGIEGIYPVHYLSHNLYFLSRAYSMEGRYADALRAAQELQELYLPHEAMMPELEYYYSAEMFTYLRFQKWKEALQVPMPPSSMQVSEILHHFGRSLAFAGLNERLNAQRERDLFTQKKEKLPSDVQFGYNSAQTVLRLADNFLKGKLAEADNNIPLAIEYLQNAIEIQDNLHYNEPPDWSFPVRESLGRILLRNGKYVEAEEVFRKDLSKHPRNGRSLFGLMTALQKLGKEDGVYWIKNAYEKAWQYSPTQLTINHL